VNVWISECEQHLSVSIYNVSTSTCTFLNAIYTWFL